MGMAKKASEKSNDEIELRKDGWERFEKAVDAAIKSGPKHKVVKKGETQPRARKGKKSGD